MNGMNNNKFRVTVVTEDLTDTENKKIQAAAAHMERVFNSEEFKQFVLNYSYTNTYTTGRLWYKKTHTEVIKHFESTEMTNEQVYQTLMNGAEILDSVIDHEADIFLKIDRRNKRGVIGYTYATTKWQWIYNWVTQNYTVQDIAGNLAHEFCHKLGFDHAYYNTPTREYSAPYAVGYFVSAFK